MGFGRILRFSTREWRRLDWWLMAAWYEFQTDKRGVVTTRLQLSRGIFRTGAAGTRLLQQLLALGASDEALGEIAKAAIAWRDHVPAWVLKRAGPAHHKKGEATVMVECYLRALGFSWEQAKIHGEVYRPPKSSTVSLSGRDLRHVEWPDKA